AGDDTTITSGLGFAMSSDFLNARSGRFTVDVRTAGSATFDHTFEGDLSAQSALTLVITGDVNDSTSFGLSVVNELDMAAQRPLIRLRRLMDDGRTARLRAVQFVADLA